MFKTDILIQQLNQLLKFPTLQFKLERDSHELSMKILYHNNILIKHTMCLIKDPEALLVDLDNITYQSILRNLLFSKAIPEGLTDLQGNQILTFGNLKELDIWR